MASLIAPLLRQGLSPYQILAIHPELNISEKTLYNYIESGVFREIAGITSLDLRRQVSRKLPKKKARSIRKERTGAICEAGPIRDYLAYLSQYPDVFLVQMDTVYNDGSNGPFLQTFKFVQAGLLFALYHEEKTASAMKDGVDLLESILDRHCFANMSTSCLLTGARSFLWPMPWNMEQIVP